MATGGPTIPTLPDADWRRRAACRDADPDSLTPVDGEGEESPRLTESRDRLCLGGDGDPCPVIDACLGWSLVTKQPTGVWGGLTTPERETLQRRQRRSA